MKQQPPAPPYTLQDFAADLADIAGAILTERETPRSQAARARLADPAIVIDFQTRQAIPPDALPTTPTAKE